jgi:hypothetical protein
VYGLLALSEIWNKTVVNHSMQEGQKRRICVFKTEDFQTQLPSAFPQHRTPRYRRSSGDSKNPALDLGYLSLIGVQVWAEKSFQTAVTISSAQPFRNTVSVVLVRVAALSGKAVAPQG